MRKLLQVSRVAERGTPNSDVWNHRGFSGREDVNHEVSETGFFAWEGLFQDRFLPRNSVYDGFSGSRTIFVSPK